MSLTKVSYSMITGAPVNVMDFGAVGDGVTDDYAAINAAWLYCYPIGANLYFPSGTYLVVTENFPFRNTQSPVTSLLDCNNMTIFGDGPSSILKTSSVLGADVLQLNGLKNFHVRNLQVQSVVSGSTAGSNGMSITGGFDNITVDNFWAYNLAYVDKSTYVDGGKAISIQPPTETDPITLNSFKATNIFADGCVYGFGYEPDNDLALVQPVSIDVDIIVMNSRQGIVLSGTETTAAVSANSTSGVRIRGQSINCMQDIVASRTFGADIDMQIIQTKTAAQLLLSYEGTQWTSVDTVANVIGVISTFSKNSRFVVYGNKKNCQHKAKIGGLSDPNSGLNGATNFCDFYFDITGTAVGVDVQFANAGGNIMTNSRLYCTTSTATSLPIEFYDPAISTLTSVVITSVSGEFSCALTSLSIGQKLTISGTLGGTGTISGYSSPTDYFIIATNGISTFQLSSSLGGAAITTTAGTPTGLTYALTTGYPNTLTIGPNTRIQNIGLTGQIGWTLSDGRTVNNTTFLDPSLLVLSTKQTTSSSASFFIQQWINQTGSPKFAIRNDGAFSTAYFTPATAVATVKAVLPIYDMAGATTGYIPIYTSFTV